MNQSFIAQFIMIVVVIFMWTTMSLCACRIIEDLLENTQKMKQEIKELKEQLQSTKRTSNQLLHKPYEKVVLVDAVHIKTA